MKRLLFALCSASLLVAAVAFAHDMNAHPSSHASARAGGMMSHEAAGQAGKWTGEILDAGCYLGHGAMGEKHKECALKCASMGMPLMMIVNGKAVLLTPNHDNPDPYNALKAWAGSNVEVTGTMATRSGVSGIDVTGSRLAANTK